MVRFLLEELSSSSAISPATTTADENDVDLDDGEDAFRRNDQLEQQEERTSTYDYARKMLAVRDDYNKTPFHDACWTATPNFDLIDLLLKYAPEQILMEDIRGNTPFEYVRKEDYPDWLKFMWRRKALLRC